MRTVILLILSCITITSTLKAQNMKNANDSLAYSLGVLVAGNLKSGGYGDISLEAFNAGLQAAMKGEKTLFTQAECEQYVSVDASRRKQKVGESTRLAGEQFLATNKERPGVITLPDGLQYEVIRMGDGPKPKATDKVKVHYHGTLIDGTIFDSSVERGEPISFGLNQVIKGWTEAVQLMPVGSKWKVFIPYQLAYGERGAGGKIQPYAALIFEIELLAIE